MRTTITLSDEIARRLQDQMRIRGSSFKETLEAVLQAGLNAKSKPNSQQKFRVVARNMKLKTGIDPTRLHDLDSDLEIERFLHVTKRQMERE